MKKVLFIWDVKSRGSPATLFYRALRGYNYKTKSGKSHSTGILDDLPEDAWDFVNRSALLVDKKYVLRIEKVFKRFDTHIDWKKYKVIIEKPG